MKTKRKTARKPGTRSDQALPAWFTVRDMNRRTAAILEACRQHGRVIIQSRGGEQFAVVAVSARTASAGPRPDFVERMRLHRERMRAAGVNGPATPEGIEYVNRIIAGET